MKKILFLLLFIISMVCNSQTYTEKYNSVNNRYEFFNSSGQMIGYQIYNSLNKQWETYTVEPPKAEEYRSTFNTGLAMTALQKRQNDYDKGKQTVNVRIQNGYNEIERFYLTKYQAGQLFIRVVKEQYKNNYVNFILNQGLDYSKIDNVDYALRILEEGLQKTITDWEDRPGKQQ